MRELTKRPPGLLPTSSLTPKNSFRTSTKNTPTSPVQIILKLFSFSVSFRSFLKLKQSPLFYIAHYYTTFRPPLTLRDLQSTWQWILSIRRRLFYTVYHFRLSRRWLPRLLHIFFHFFENYTIKYYLYSIFIVFSSVAKKFLS